MKIAVMSDIHSNHIAFRACVSHMRQQSADAIIFLGDYVSDCPNPQETLTIMKELMEEYQTWVIKGNREEYFIHHADGAKDGWSYSSYNGSLLYTYEGLTREDIEQFRSYPASMKVEVPGTEPITIVHGSPASTRELLYQGLKNTKQYLEGLDTRYLLCGHTHNQFTYEYQGKLLLNPGSVGVAIGGHAAADYAILEWKEDRWDYELFSVPYDFRSLEEEFRDSDLMRKARVWPRCILKSIDSGTNMGPVCAKMAYDFAKEQDEMIDNRIIPEKYWELAARILGIH